MSLDEVARSSVMSAVGGWLTIVGTATIKASYHLYAEAGPYPLVGGIERFLFPAASIEAVKVAGYLSGAVGMILIAIAALGRASHDQVQEGQTQGAPNDLA